MMTDSEYNAARVLYLLNNEVGAALTKLVIAAVTCEDEQAKALVMKARSDMRELQFSVRRLQREIDLSTLN